MPRIIIPLCDPVHTGSWAFHPRLSQTTSGGKPNILIILTDNQGYQDVSYYGTQDLQTPPDNVHPNGY